MATKTGKRPTKKVKSLKAKSLSATKAKRVRGGIIIVGGRGANLGVQSQKVRSKPDDINSSRLYNKGLW